MHYVTGLSVIGSVSALMAIGTVSASEGLPIITGTAAVLIGGALGATIPK